MIDNGIMKDEAAQTAAEYVLLFGGIIVIVLVAIISYQNYVKGLGGNLTNGSEIQSVENNLQDINQKLNQT
ncbi:class III signal peptide-containing protein [Methanobacterium subterraneum]|uniref:Class III signal peptide-containing protein n=3 Tax=Methanobacteriaceae TaxID=2159 RepID=A0A7K4DK97_9EURY|nr:class III signal peptide-containing protein [Methanobacterium sp. YSL]NMO08446.1 class III signal peptide-containing protein [Methanobacterium subterraneum]PKL71056.1 MAG: class III signal peptide-containing protein [Methanobacteriales archaeon HGW-Methanobacteriales-2]